MLSMLPRTHSITLELQLVKALWHGQFLPLQQLQDESNPDFVVEVVFRFFYDSKKLLNGLTIAFIAAQRVKNACIAFCNFFEEQNIATCLRCLQQVKQEYYLVNFRYFFSMAYNNTFSFMLYLFDILRYYVFMTIFNCMNLILNFGF
ncbi:PREDICTED: histidine-containing phosphotransfer protein 1 [Theobroma cacao]|uniref:Histidine-containing phosphotransfer protein n=1 Tax=Theobroma cacao TaxID=3641 RepID=A0AB32W3V8_THECC|nr:PREDICTED: histidine-containing phosphotransfer protein 1 [Theobroma cacao]